MRGTYLYAQARKIARGKNVPELCQRLVIEAIQAGMSANQAYRHVARAVEKTLVKKKKTS